MILPVRFFFPGTFMTRTFRTLTLKSFSIGATHLNLVGSEMNFEVVLVLSVSRDRALFRNQRLFYDLMQFHYDISAPSIFLIEGSKRTTWSYFSRS